MKPWEFVIREASDLPAFADLLEEWGHPGHFVVRHMIKEGKFPRKIEYRASAAWEFEVVSAVTVKPKDSHQLPDRSLRRDWVNLFFTATEAVWAVINAGEYLPWGQRYGKERVPRLNWSD